MKIVFLARSLERGGAERQLVTLATGLHRRGHTVLVALFYRGGDLEEELERQGIPIHHFEKGGRWDVLRFMQRAVAFVRRERPDIVHGYLSVSNIFALLLSLASPGTRVAWGLRSASTDWSIYDWVDRGLFVAESCLSRFSDVIISNSEAGVRHARSIGFSRRNMVVIHNGIDTAFFRPDGEARVRFRQTWNIEDKQQAIGIVASLSRRKDHGTFLKAAALLARELPDARFVCVGEGGSAYQRELVKLTEDLGLVGRVLWTGKSTDMLAVYNGLDVLVSSSTEEGFSNSVAEAAACGLPCVVTDIGDSALIVGDRGDVVPMRDPAAIKRAVSRRLAGAEAANGRDLALRERIVSSFSLAALEQNTEATLAKLLV
jgi:glycosyltransferase involved in cell wall biosynthesis